MRIQIQKFDPRSIKPNRIILLVAKRNSGKSVLMRDLMYHMHQNVDFGLAMTPTEDSAEMFRACMPEQWIYSGFDAVKLDQLITIQRELSRKKKQRALYLCMDDCMYDKKVLRSTQMRDVFMNGRHLGITFINAMQYVMDMPPDLRTNVDYVFALRETIISNKTKLWKYFFGMFDRFEDFSRVMDTCTADFSCLVLDNTSRSNKLEDCLFHYKAELDTPPFVMGKDTYIQLARQHQKSSDDIHRETFEKHEVLRQEERDKRRRARITCVERHDEKGRVIPEDDSVQLIVSS